MPACTFSLQAVPWDSQVLQYCSQGIVFGVEMGILGRKSVVKVELLLSGGCLCWRLG